MKEIIFSGSGGQGVLTVGLIISQVAVFKGYYATWIPQYGSAMRGGTANCTVKFGEEYVYNPSQEEPDILLAMNNPSFIKFMPLVKSGGTIIVNSDLVDTKLLAREDVKLIEIPCTTLANELNHPLGANIIMAGAIVKESGDFNESEAVNGMNDMFRKKGKDKYEELNTRAFAAGYNYC